MVVWDRYSKVAGKGLRIRHTKLSANPTRLFD